MAHVIEVVEKGMGATQRCDRCGAQAFVEVVLGETMGGSTLLFCAHHATENWDGPKGLKNLPDAMIADHRPALGKMEAKEPEPA